MGLYFAWRKMENSEDFSGQVAHPDGTESELDVSIHLRLYSELDK